MTTTLHEESTVAAAHAFTTRPGDRRFFSVMSVVTAATIIAGFSSTYAPKVLAGASDLPAIVHLHALVFTSWLVVFVLQTMLVLNGRVAVHRRLGIAAVVLAASMVVIGVVTAITVARMGHRGIPGVEFPDAEGFLLLNLGATAVFGTLVGAGFYFRRSPQTHKRLMLMATAGALMGPGIARLPFASGKPPVIGVLALAFLLAGPAYDLVTRRRVHPAYLWSGMLAISSIPPVAAAVSSTAAWHIIAAWLIR